MEVPLWKSPKGSPDSKTIKGKISMEFLQLLMLFVAVMLIWFRPANEKLAWCLTIVAWFSVVFMYVGHVSTAILGNINL